MEALHPSCLPAYLALVRGSGPQDGDEGVVVQRTFLAVRCAPEVPLRPRAASAPPPPGACDRFEETLAALTNKPSPVPCVARGPPTKKPAARLPPRLLDRPGELEEEGTPSESTADSTAVPDADSEEGASEVPCSVTSAASNRDPQRALPLRLSEELPLQQDPQRAVPLRLSEELSLQQEPTAPLAPGPALASPAAAPPAAALPAASPGGTAVAADEELLRRVPLDAQGLPTSVGSLEHADGTCKPCLFAHHASKACANGLSCPFCHFEHPPKRRVKSIYRQKRG